jgi:hypothetical protein
MPSEKTRRFSRLLRTQQQLERGVEWRYAEARAQRAAAEDERDLAIREIARTQTERAGTMSSDFNRMTVLVAVASERAAEARLAEKQAKVAECLAREQQVAAVLTAMRVKTKQWEKLHENAVLIDDEEDLRVLQASWDEHGLRGHGVAALKVPQEAEDRP